MASQTIDQAYINTYTNNVYHFFQQKGSKLRPYVREEVTPSEFHNFERMHPTAAKRRTTKFGDTEYIDVVHSRRRAEKFPHDWPALIDQIDVDRILINPQSEYVLNGGWAMGRAYDQEVIAALGGSAMEGKTGGSLIALPGTQKVAHNSLNMNLTKLRATRLKFDDNDVEELNQVGAVSPSAVYSMLGEEKITSSDYAAIKALVDGDIGSYMGFTFIKMTGLPKSGDIRLCYFWHPWAVGMVSSPSLPVTVDRLPTKNNAVQIYVYGDFGGVRVLDQGVVEVAIDESKEAA